MLKTIAEYTRITQAEGMRIISHRVEKYERKEYSPTGNRRFTVMLIKFLSYFHVFTVPTATQRITIEKNRHFDDKRVISAMFLKNRLLYHMHSIIVYIRV